MCKICECLAPVETVWCYVCKSYGSKCMCSSLRKGLSTYLVVCPAQVRPGVILTLMDGSQILAREEGLLSALIEPIRGLDQAGNACIVPKQAVVKSTRRRTARLVGGGWKEMHTVHVVGSESNPGKRQPS